MEEKKILIICGEPSGELNAAGLVQSIKKINPGIKISAVGSNLLRQAGAEIIYDIKGLAVIGLFDALKKLPLFLSLKNTVLNKIAEERFDLIILVDFSGFNLRLAKVINKSIPLIYYISPQVWASRPGRIKTIKEYINKMLVVFKFEEEFYKQHGIDAEFVGHPLLDIVKANTDKNLFLKSLGLSGHRLTIALLPGSRKQEIKNILPLMLKTAQIIHKKIELAQFLIAKSANVDLNIYDHYLRSFKLPWAIIEGRTYDCLQAADFSLVCSGTATLETAIMEKPFCVIYKMNLLNYFLYRPLIKIPYIGMANIIAGKEIVPEFIQFQATAKNIAREVIRLLENPKELERIKNDLREVKNKLGEKGASLRAAQNILKYLNQT